MSRVTMVSADSHAGLPAEEYRPYLDVKYREFFDWHLEDNRAFHALFRRLGFPYGPEVLDVIDRRGVITGGGYAGFYDPTRRLRIAEAEGVVAEILHPAGPISLPPFCDTSSRLVSHELRAAGTLAYNRFLAEFCHTDPKRLIGVALTYPWPSMDAAVKTIRWAAERGMAAIYPPRFAGFDLPAFYDPYWDPFWAACSDTGLVVHIHAGTGRRQGASQKRTPETLARLQQGGIPELFEDIFEERRPLWQLMWSGAFDRFPDLKVCFVEIRADWVPQTLAYLDRRYAKGGEGLPKLTPSEYWQRHCAVTASFMRPTDLAVRNDVGLEKFMFGTDYPHAESTWPNTLEYLRVVLDGVSESDTRAILGENAIDFYHLDKKLLDGLAAQVGFQPSDLLDQSSTVDPRLVDHFAKRNGLRKAPQYDEARLETALDQDIEGVAALAS